MLVPGAPGHERTGVLLMKHPSNPRQQLTQDSATPVIIAKPSLSLMCSILQDEHLNLNYSLDSCIAQTLSETRVLEYLSWVIFLSRFPGLGFLFWPHKHNSFSFPGSLTLMEWYTRIYIHICKHKYRTYTWGGDTKARFAWLSQRLCDLLHPSVTAQAARFHASPRSKWIPLILGWLRCGEIRKLSKSAQRESLVLRRGNRCAWTPKWQEMGSLQAQECGFQSFNRHLNKDPLALRSPWWHMKANQNVSQSQHTKSQEIKVRNNLSQQPAFPRKAPA